MSECIVVTGATGKIGAQLTKSLVAAGESVVAVASRREGLAELQADCAAASLNAALVRPLAIDLTQPNAAAELPTFLKDAGLRPRGLVNNARSLSLLATARDGSVARENFAGEFLLDVIVPYELTLALANGWQGSLTSVVNVASMYGIVAPNPQLYEGSLAHSPINYGVAKAALLHLTRELAVRLAPRVRVNAVSYGGVAGRADANFMQRYAQLCPAGRMLKDDEVAGPVTFLLSAASSSVTGHNLVADGGWSVW
jgi:NAD(P)-dependent dehydrogenase (short-subunit alcohol dehydrogenase family)